MRVAPNLQTMALLALEEALQECRYRRVRRSVAIRLALAYLWTEAEGDKAVFVEFWRRLDDWNDLHRFGYADQALQGIYHQVRVERDYALTQRMWGRRQAEEEARKASKQGAR
jgi:hypothetical protein